MAAASEPVLGAVPLDEAGGRWAVAAPSGVIILDEDGIDVRHAWDRINRGTWDARERTFTLELLDEAEPLVLVVPDRVSTATEDGRDGERAVEEKMFDLALRQRVNAAIIHHASATLPDGRRITASVRRRPDGVLYSVTDPPVGGGDADRELGLDDIDALTSLEDRVRDAVGLPTT